MSIDDSAAHSGRGSVSITAAGLALAAVAFGLGLASQDNPDGRLAPAAAILGVIAMLIAGYGVARRPKDTVTLLLAAATGVFAGLATNPAWDSIRLMQWVMAATAAVAAVIVLLPPTAQRLAFSLLVLYHFAGICSAITSPDPQPWLTAQLWGRVFRPHLEFSYVNNAYQFYSPQPGPAQILWFCITGVDGEPRWYKTPIKGEMLDPLGIEYFRRLSLTERANQMTGAPPGTEAILSRRQIANLLDLKFHPEVAEVLQYKLPTEHGRHIIEGYARHAARVVGTGRWNPPDGKLAGTPVAVHDVKVYLTQHEMINQLEYQKNKDPYAPETYHPYFMGQFDGEGRPMMSEGDRAMLYWLVPIYKLPTGDLLNIVIRHAGSDPFDPALAWRQEPEPKPGAGVPAEGGSPRGSSGGAR